MATPSFNSPTLPREKAKKAAKGKVFEQFDPYLIERIRNVTDYQNEILDLYDQARHEGETRRGRRYIRCRYIQNLDQDLTPTFMQNSRENE